MYRTPTTPTQSRSSNASHTNPMEYTSSGDSTVVRTCLCGQEVVVRTSWTNLNPGRHFWGCPGDGGSYCNVFQWVDPPMCRRSKEIIPGLLTKIVEKDRLLHDLRQKVYMKESTNRKLITYRFLGVFLVLISLVLAILYVRAMMSCM